MNTQKEIDAFFQSPASPWLRQLTEWTGNAPAVAPYGTNAWAYTNVTKECVVFGPGSIDQAHGAEEWEALDELEKAAAIYARAYEQNAEFYAFYRSLEAYKQSFKNKSDVMVLEPNSEFFKYLKNSKPSK